MSCYTTCDWLTFLNQLEPRCLSVGMRILPGLIKDGLLVHVPMSSHVALIPC